MNRGYIRWIIFAGLAAFVPLFYYLAVVGGFLPYGAILLIAIRNPLELLWFSVAHLILYGLLLYWLAGLITRLLTKVTRNHIGVAIVIFLLILAGVGLMPIYGIAHGEVQCANVYELYTSNKLK
jgi:hypothetical protein